MEDIILPYPTVQDMVMKTESLSHKALLAFLYLTGARISEALYVLKSDIKVENDTVFIRINVLKRREVYSHTIPISVKAPLMDILLAWWTAKTEGKLWEFTRQTAWNIVKRVNPEAHPHTFRHTRMTRLAESGATLWELMVWAGWKNGSTADKYIHSSSALITRLKDMIL